MKDYYSNRFLISAQLSTILNIKLKIEVTTVIMSHCFRFLIWAQLKINFISTTRPYYSSNLYFKVDI